MLTSTSPNPLARSDHQKAVDRFMHLAGQEMPAAPCIPSAEVRILRAKLIFEEAMETIRGLGVRILGVGSCEDHAFEDRGEDAVDFPEVVDGCCDLRVVTTGTLTAFGVADVLPQLEVDNANLRKFGPGGHRRADGKWQKPKDFIPPDMAAVIENQLQAAS